MKISFGAVSRTASLVLAVASLVLATAAGAFETNAKQAILIDVKSAVVLYEKNADEIMFPASMSKIMTAYLLFERLRDQQLALTDTLPVSETAWRKGGSKMFVEVGSQVSVEDLVRGIVVQSGNDASIAIAEGLAGSEDAFAARMTQRARDLGMRSTVYRNATGWPHPEHVTTARDLARLAGRLIADFPEYYHYFKEKTFTYNSIKQGNRNPLLFKELGADGLKTGHTDASGFGLTASLMRNGRRLVLVINGVESARERGAEAERLAEFGFREFENLDLFNRQEAVAEADVWLGERPTVPLVLADDLTATMPRGARRDLRVSVVYNGPISAPIEQGTPIATLIVTAPGLPTVERSLLAGADIGQRDFFGRITGALSYIVLGAGGS